MAAECARLLPRPLVLVHGLFDVVDRSVVTYLAAAREFGAALVVGLRSDASAALVGEQPLCSEDDRACVLDALESVTMVVLFDEARPLALIEALRPEVHALPEHELPSLEEAHQVQRLGGRVELLACQPPMDPAVLAEHLRGAAASAPGYPRVA
jgi:rfaE bifunctional protein nucleotidyltransferase chain/domain